MGGFVELGDCVLTVEVMEIWMMMIRSKRRRNSTRMFFESCEEGAKEGGCCHVFRMFCSVGLRNGRGLRNPFFLFCFFSLPLLNFSVTISVEGSLIVVRLFVNYEEGN